MDPQTLFNATFGITSAALGWFAKTLYGAVTELRRDLNALHVEMARDYVPTRRFEESIASVSAKLDSIIDKLDAKADR
jgi:hypothetical protein